MRNKGIQRAAKGGNMPRAPYKNREVTTRLILDAAASLIRENGLKKFRVNHVAKRAGRSKRMIYDYFGNIDGLLLAVLKESDYWLESGDHAQSIIASHQADQGKELAALSLKNHFKRFASDPLLQEVGIQEISSSTDFLTKLSAEREKQAKILFDLSAEHFKNTDVYFKAVEALLIGGINYIILHGKVNGSTFYGIDINHPDHKAKISKTLEQITKWAYENAKKNE